MKRHASAASMCLLLITAGALYGQSAPPVRMGGQFQDLVERIRLSINAVEQTDLDRVEKNVEWARQYLGKTWKAILLARGQEYKQPLVIDGGRPLFVNITWSCDNRTVFQFDNQLGITAAFTFPNEQSAYCFAGATCWETQFDHVLIGIGIEPQY